MGINRKSWRTLMRDPSFFDRYKLNTNPAIGATYIPISIKLVSPNKNNPNRFINPKKRYSMSESKSIFEVDTIKNEELRDRINKIIIKHNFPTDSDWGYFYHLLESLEECYNMGVGDATKKFIEQEIKM
jgi:hypothetical protein